MSLFERESWQRIFLRWPEVFDVVGAGDTVIAALTLGLAGRESCWRRCYYPSQRPGLWSENGCGDSEPGRTPGAISGHDKTRIRYSQGDICMNDDAISYQLRYDSVRFPGKSLVDIGGKPMIQHV